jgi:hypothetical protein
VSSNFKLDSLEPETFFYFTLLVSSTADLLRKTEIDNLKFFVIARIARVPKIGFYLTSVTCTINI